MLGMNSREIHLHLPPTSLRPRAIQRSVRLFRGKIFARDRPENAESRLFFKPSADLGALN